MSREISPNGIKAVYHPIRKPEEGHVICWNSCQDAMWKNFGEWGVGVCSIYFKSMEQITLFVSGCPVTILGDFIKFVLPTSEKKPSEPHKKGVDGENYYFSADQQNASGVSMKVEEYAATKGVSFWYSGRMWFSDLGCCILGLKNWNDAALDL
ncbi:hypothetical protein COCNU_02G018720 [Cocos nucifera]|uniref:Uncharacterized protein n=1 Tax=Cocos nucifera TaxID=13894 RepID=A0A8K0I1P2_COCNU|nr:hypothetical protein COCNU_02G018720 [Cocos nucifera]